MYTSASALARRLLGGETHPVHERRIEGLKAELERWEEMRAKAREERQKAKARAQAQEKP